MKKNIFFIFIFHFLFSILSNGQIPSYYNNINFSKNGTELKKQLSELLIKTHTTLLYYTHKTKPDVWSVLKNSDLDPDDSTKKRVLLIYGYDDSSTNSKFHRTRDVSQYCKKGSCIGMWAREHVFAKSLANPKMNTNKKGIGTDAHNLRAIDQQYNSTRGNKYFTDEEGYSKTVSKKTFYPGDEWKGSTARIIMYMVIRYPKECKANNTAVSSYTYNSTMPDLYLNWNAEKAPNIFEKLRNDKIYEVQGNRNPFIDNPYIATLIWGGPKALNTWIELEKNN